MILNKLKVISYNCRGWQSGIPFVSDLLKSCDICLIQEHWLFSDQFNALNINSDFCSISVSGMDSSELILGRPYGGCAILFQRSLLPFITRLDSNSRRFCGLLISHDSFVTLLICVYLPTDYGSVSSHDYFTETVGELCGFVDSLQYDNLIIAGDFNVDFTRPGVNCSLLLSCMDDLGLCSVDTSSYSPIHFTYERDDGSARSWPDHVLTSQYQARRITDIGCIYSADNFSDHLPLYFSLDLSVTTTPLESTPPSGCSGLKVDWPKVTAEDIDRYCNSLSASFPSISPQMVDCTDPNCQVHLEDIDSTCEQILSCLSSSACLCFPKKCRRTKTVPGWNDHARPLRSAAVFWNNVWKEAGCPSSGVLSQIRKHTKRRYKYAVRRLMRNRNNVIRQKLGAALAESNQRDFWKEVKNVRRSANGLKQVSSIVDGFSDDVSVTNLFASKLGTLLNTCDPSDSNDLLSEFQHSLSPNDINNISVSPETVAEALSSLKKDKSDGSELSSNHLILASSVLPVIISQLFTAILRHGYMPKSLRDCTLVPILKSQKDPAVSDSYRPIALAPNLSKVLEWCFLLNYGQFLCTSELQFGFKRGCSTDLCSGVLKNVISCYNHSGTSVFSCFLDASKAFDRVNHFKLFRLLLDRDLPMTLARFLLSWYRMQSLRVRWNSTCSDAFSVSNGVRQGGVLSPILFTVYLDALISRLSSAGVGCHFYHHFVGVLCYADDIALIAPSPSALRFQLNICEQFALEYDLLFNSAKSQLICFSRTVSSKDCVGAFHFCGSQLKPCDSVVHLGHTLHATLRDDEDIKSITKDMCRKANYVLHTFSCCSPAVKTKLFYSYCLSLYGASTWNISNKQINSLEVAFNNILRRIWSLPRNCHTRILHCVARIPSLFNKIHHLSNGLWLKASVYASSLVNCIFAACSSLVFTNTGFNRLYGHRYCKDYSPEIFFTASCVHHLLSLKPPPRLQIIALCCD